MLTSPSDECLFSALLCAFVLDLAFCHSFPPSLHVNLPCRRATECSLACHTSVLSMSMTKPQAYSRALGVVGPSCLPCRAHRMLSSASYHSKITHYRNALQSVYSQDSALSALCPHTYRDVCFLERYEGAAGWLGYGLEAHKYLFGIGCDGASHTQGWGLQRRVGGWRR